MSTSSTMSGLSHVPSGSFGHSRRPPRGHMRSGNWSQIPPTMPPPVEMEKEETDESTGNHNNGHDHHHDDSEHHNGHNYKPDVVSGHNHSHSHSISVSHSHGHNHAHNHSHSHSHSITTGGPSAHMEGSGATPTSGVKTSDAYATPFQTSENAPLSYEISTGILTGIPWSVLSWYMRQYTSPTSHKVWRMLKVAAAKQKILNTYSPETEVDAVWWRTLVLVSTTMISIGGIALLRRKRAGQSVPSTSGLQLNLNSGRKVLLRLLSLALPIYAGMVIGGTIVALALGLTNAAGVPTILQLQSKDGRLRDKLGNKKASLFVLSLFLVLNVLGYDFPIDTQPFRGYIALIISIFILRPPFATPRDSIPAVQKPEIDSIPRLLDGFVALASQQASALLSSPLVASSEDIQLTLASGGLLGVICILVSPFSLAKTSFGISDLILTLFVSIIFALSFILSSPLGLRSRQKVGFIATILVVVFTSAAPHEETSRMAHFSWSILAAFCYFAAFLDDPKPGEITPAKTELSPVTKFLLQRGESWPILHSILMKEDSRKIFYFMCLNFGFMLVQLTYGFVTGSLGLLSDSIHMFFDCLALVVGLSASVMSKWPPSVRFPYGYGKVDTLSGFANGVFLMIISIEIIYEAIERLSSGSEMRRIEELLVVSIAGLAVNLVGIMAFDHGHAHGHDHGHDHGHGHSHGNENMHGIFLHIMADTLGSVAVVISTILVHFYGWSGFDPIASCLIAILIFASAVPLVSSTASSLLLSLPADVEYNLRDTLAGVSTLRGVVGYTVPKFWLDDTTSAASTGDDHGHGHGHSHDHSHGHSHSLSKGHHGHDHSHDHDHDHHDHEHDHDHTHSDSHHDHDHEHGHDHDHDHGDHSHSHSESKILGTIHIIASRNADLEDVRKRTVEFLKEKHMDIVVQVEREGEGRCWCAANGSTIGNRSPYMK